MRRTKLNLAEVSIGGGEKLFCVTWPKPGPGRNRQFFKNKAQAKTLFEQKQKELENFGRAGAGLTDHDRYLFYECCEALKPFGKSLRDATEFFVKHLRTAERSCTAEELVAELCAAKQKDGLSKSHLRDIRCRLNVFSEKFNGQTVATISSRDIDSFLRSLPHSPFTRNRYRSLISLAFNFAVRNGYATTNPAAGAAKAKVVSKAPGILTVQQTAALLKAATPELRPYVAIGAFAGLRRAELERLDWGEIDFENDLILVTAEKAKTAQKRFVSMQPNLRKWLWPLRKYSGHVAPRENLKPFGATREAAGISVWPENALRHSFASYHLAHFKNAATTALQLGHMDARITFQHYRELVKPADAEQYWQIVPSPDQSQNGGTL